MYKKVCKLLLFSLMGSFFEVEAQNQINALDYILQKRPTVDSIPGKHWYDNMFLSGAVGVESTINGITVLPGRHRLGPTGAVYIGKWLNSVSGLRLGIQGGVPMHQRTDLARRYYIHGGLSFDYMMDWSNYLYGYKPNRHFHFIPFVGAGAEVSALTRDRVKAVGVLRGGVQAAFRLRQGMQFFLEPGLRIFTDQYNHQTNWRRFDITPALMAGLTYQMVPLSQRIGVSPFLQDHTLDHFFISAATGPAIMISGSTFSRDFYNRVGPTCSMSIGNWFTPTSGLRLSVTGSVYQSASTYLTMFGGQLDYMLNIQSLFEGYQPERFFKLYGIAGLNVAFPEKTGNTRNSVGGGFGLQGNFRLSSVMDFFVEPRLNIYSDKFAGGYSIGKVDLPAQLMLGFTYHRPDNKPFERILFDKNGTLDHLFVSAGVGMNASIAGFLRSIKGDGIQPYMTASIGKWFTPISGVRLNAQAGLLGEVDNRNRYVRTKLFGIGADYLVDLTNLLEGYEESRLLHLRGFMGIASLFNTSAYAGEDKELSWGLVGGFQGSIRVTPSLELYLEPKLGVYTNTLTAGVFPPLKKDLLGSVSAGLIYRFSDYSVNANRASFDATKDARDFVAFAGGIGTDVNSAAATWHVGPQFEVYYGRHYSPLSSWRAGFRYSHYPQIPKRDPATYQNYYGADLDYMMNLSTLAVGYEADRVFQVNAVAGLSAGISNADEMHKFVPGIHGALNVGVRLNPQIMIFAEPRADLYGKNFMMNNNYRKYDVSISGMLGLSFTLR